MAYNSPPTFNLLSIGHRGVGKSVFLAGSYAELQFNQQIESQQGTWFEGANAPSQQMLDKLLSYMRLQSRYPTPTMKITDFTFRVVSRSFRQDKTLCEFRWADIPGEICHLGNSAFEAMMLKSHGCCVFIDAEALVRDPKYLARLEDTIKQIEVISSLATQNRVRYFFALILTKCDQLKAGPATLAKVEQQWQSLTKQLVTTNAVYRRFKSSVSLITMNGPAVVRAEGTAAPILWLVSELSKAYQNQVPQTLGGDVDPSQEAHVLSSNHPPALRSKVIAMLAALGVVAGIWVGLTHLLSQRGPAESPNVNEEAPVSTDNEL
ncbi:MAG: hypothetical protein AAF329_17955 [Cyanobacteria bacterium P01_A01_bin.17]